MEKKTSTLGLRDRFALKLMTTQILTLAFHLMHFFVQQFCALIYFRKLPGVPPDSNPLLKLSATMVARKIREGELTSERLVETYINRIKVVNKYLNAVIEDRFKDAMKEAKLCDATLQSGKYTAAMLEKEKPLYGVPITVKESCGVKGMSYTCGTLARKGIKASDDSVIVATLREAGAIPLCVTNVPEMCCSYDTTNFLFGRTVNPYDRRKVAGGSSGGEGALIGVGASLLGFGSDLLGSIKVPSLYNGIFGHKPSPGIVSVIGHFPMSDDPAFQKIISLGPMARYVEDLYLAMKVISSKCERPLRWDEPVDLKKLHVFYMESFDSPFGIRLTTQDIRGAILAGTYHLEKACASVDQLTQDWVSDMFQIVMCIFGNIDVPNVLLDSENPKDKKDALLEFFKAVFRQSQYGIDLTLMALLKETHRFASPATVQHFSNLRMQLSQKFNDLLKDDGVFICPTSPAAASFPQVTTYECDYCIYGGIANTLHLPATNVPMGLNADGLPIGFQVIAGTNQDRLCLAVAKELEKEFGGWVCPSS